MTANIWTMCISLDSGVLVPVVAVIAALALATFFNLSRFAQAIRGVSDERGWIEAVEDCGPYLLTNAIWLFIAFLAARACGIFG